MPPHFYDRLPPGWFNPPGLLQTTNSAITIAKAFALEVNQRIPPEDWVICFDWADDRRVRVKGTNEWHVLGPGLDVSAYERRKLPDGFTQSQDGFEFLVKIPEKILRESKQYLIDTESETSNKLILR